jgi:hypothetical protein
MLVYHQNSRISSKALHPLHRESSTPQSRDTSEDTHASYYHHAWPWNCKLKMQKVEKNQKVSHFAEVYKTKAPRANNSNKLNIKIQVFLSSSSPFFSAYSSTISIWALSPPSPSRVRSSKASISALILSRTCSENRCRRTNSSSRDTAADDAAQGVVTEATAVLVLLLAGRAVLLLLLLLAGGAVLLLLLLLVGGAVLVIGAVVAVEATPQLMVMLWRLLPCGNVSTWAHHQL